MSTSAPKPNLETFPFLLHVGLHKCASTWLQRYFFENSALGLHAPWGGMSHHAITEFVTVDPLHFSAGQARARLTEAAHPLPPATRICVMSHEALSSRPWQGSYYAPYVAERLRATFGNARILLIFREQEALIYSLYGEYLRIGGRETLREFLGTPDDPPGFCGICRLDFFHFDRLIAMYREVFGQDRVLALPLELLAREPQDFTARISGFLDIEPPQLPTGKRANVASRALTNALYRRSNYVIRPDALKPQNSFTLRARHKVFGFFDRFVPDSLHARLDARWRSAIRDRVGATFAESNARTADMLSLDLETLGYRLDRNSI